VVADTTAVDAITRDVEIMKAVTITTITKAVVAAAIVTNQRRLSTTHKPHST
jgi:hypothetical protein